MFIFSWLRDLLSYLGLASKSGKLVFLGLDNAGKTTLLSMIKDDRLTQHVPTLHPTSEELVLGGVRLTTYDLGGHAQARRVWRTYFPAVDAIVFIVDACDRDRFGEAKAELDGLLQDPQVAACPVLVLGNKIDCPNAASEDELRVSLGLSAAVTGKAAAATMKELGGRRPVELFMCSVLRKQGYAAGLRWLAQYL